MLGRLLAEWGEAPAGCLFLLPLWHPVLVAEQIGTLAAIARGPFVCNAGDAGGIELRIHQWHPSSGLLFLHFAGSTPGDPTTHSIAGPTLALWSIHSSPPKTSSVMPTMLATGNAPT